MFSVRALSLAALSLAALSLVATSTSIAHAHLGLGPVASAVTVDADDDAHLVVSTNFGVLESRDGGASFRWTCAAAIGASAYAEEPPLLPTPSGVLVGTFFEGPVRLEDPAAADRCTPAALAEGPLAGRYVAAMVRGPAEVFAATADGARDNLVAVSRDGARTFAPLGEAIPSALLASLALDGGGDLLVSGTRLDASSRPADGFVVALDPTTGASTPRAVVPLADGELGPRIAAVDAHRAWAIVRGIDVDRLLVSEDDGSSFDEVLRARAIDGVAVHEGRVWAALAREGVVVSEDGRTFASPPDAEPGLVALCIASVRGELWICGEPAAGGPLLAELDPSGRVAREILRAEPVPTAPPGCESLAMECAPWADELRASLGARDAGVSLDAAITHDAATSLGDGSVPDAGAATPTPGCGCRAGRSHDTPFPALLLVAVLASGWRSRSRR